MNWVAVIFAGRFVALLERIDMRPAERAARQAK